MLTFHDHTPASPSRERATMGGGAGDPPLMPVLAVTLSMGRDIAARLPRLEAYVSRHAPVPLSRHPAWLDTLARGLGHHPYLLEADADGELRGFLPLAYVRSLLFGRILASLPYLNYGGVFAEDEETARLLIDRAVELAASLGTRYLELRHSGHAIEHTRRSTKR